MNNAYHHLLHHSASLSIQVAEFAVLRLDLGGIDFRMMRQYIFPPRHLVYFFQVNQQD